MRFLILQNRLFASGLSSSELDEQASDPEPLLLLEGMSGSDPAGAACNNPRGNETC
jgi:hypothetical protein